MKINNREISSSMPPYVVAEIGANHAGVFDNAIKLIDAAKAAGADAIKFQCFEADRITLDCSKPDFTLKSGPWAGRTLHDLYKTTETPREWFPRLFQRANEVGIAALSSVFSPEDIDFLEGLDCPAYKIASMECNDTPLIEYAAKTGKPIIISAGMASLDEILDAANYGNYSPPIENRNRAVLHCISGYPTPIEEAGLNFLSGLISTTCAKQVDFDGISDHTLGVEIPIAATALGATIIEKHIRLYANEYNELPEDFEFSTEPEEFAKMCSVVRAIWQAMQPSERKSEESSRQARRSLYVVENIRQGEAFTSKNIRSIRPAYGLQPKELPRVLKSYAACDLERGTALQEGHLLPF